MASALIDFINKEWKPINRVAMGMRPQEVAVEKLAYEPCSVCGEMIEEDNDPEAYEGDEVICSYCRENKNLPFDDPADALAEHRNCLDIERARAAGVD